MSISRRDGDLVVGLLNIILFLAFQTSEHSMNSRQEDILAQMPQNIREALFKCNLDSSTTTFAVCPACHCTYEPSYKQGSTVPIYDEFCTNRRTPESEVCREPLLRRGKDDGILQPIKPFVYHDFHDYLASLLSRADLELQMDESCDKLMRSVSDSPEFVSDIWEADFLRHFKDPSNRTLFIDRHGEGRYGFTLNIDFFNIEGMRIHGRTSSCGIISMACLNLPPEIRYKPENMYVAGLIPPPHEPSLTELNHYSRHIIKQMKESWERGVRYSRTALHSKGRNTRSAIIAAVMDLPAARQASALAAHSSHFYCSVCQCFHRSTMGRVDHTQWKLRDDQILRHQAERWRDASSAQEQEEIFKTYGVRWSPLWELSYWSPSRQLVVDAMHCLLGGLAETHFRHTLVLTSASANSGTPNQPAFSYKFCQVDLKENPLPDEMSLKEGKQVAAIHTLLTTALAGIDENGQIDQETFQNSVQELSKRLLSKNTKPLVFVSHDLKLQPQGSVKERCLPGKPVRLYKKDWVDALVEWVSTRSSSRPHWS